MTNGYIEKSAVEGILKELGKSYRIIAPVKRNDFIEFDVLGADDKPVLEFQNTKNIPKKFFFPQHEKMLSYEGYRVGDYKLSEAQVEAPKTVIFAMRPCDAKSFVLIDHIFDDPQYKDPYYLDKRKNTVIVSLGCNEPCPTCFCNWVDCGPFSKEGGDVFLTDTGSGYVIEELTDKGKSVLKAARQPSEEENKKAEELSLKAEKKLSKPAVTTDAVKAVLYKNFDSPFWKEFSEICLNCGTCTYFCPTCHCFDIQDECESECGKRVRNWDSCMFDIFTLHGSGHQPRTEKLQRVRQRFMHKFKYFPDNFKSVACVGCGRCVTNCPVNIDVREFLATVK
ncbi:MAG: 4Fe-4S dicluster domain-containing protein [Planctomycetota bacterium]